MIKKIRIAVVLLLAVIAAAFSWRYFANREFFYAGTIEATEVDLSPRVSSVIAAFKVKEGEAVKSGQTLVELAGEDIKLAALQAERDYNRAVKLRKEGSMTQEAFDRLEFRHKDAALKVEWCSILSPLDGTVLDTYFEAGEQVGPGMKLLTLADLSEVWAVVYVPQTLLAKISLNMAVQGVIPELKMRRFEGRITHIASEAEFTPKNVQTRNERTRLVYGVKVVFPNPDGTLKPGMTIEVKLPEAK